MIVQINPPRGRKPFATERFPAVQIPQSQLQLLMQQFDGAMTHAMKTTKHVYRKALDQLMSFANENAFDFTPDNFGEFRLWLFNRKKLSKNTVNVYLTACRRFCDFLVELGVLQKNPALSVHGTAPEFKIMEINLTAVANKISTIDRTPILGKRDFAFLCIIFETGASVSELIGADISDLKKNGSKVELRVKQRGAHGKFEVVTLPNSAAAAIDDYVNSRGETSPDEPLFCTVRGGKATKIRLSQRGTRFAMRRRLNFGNGNKIRLDSLRTYCAVRLMSKGKTSNEIRSIMRLRSNMPLRKIMFNTKAVAGYRG